MEVIVPVALVALAFGALVDVSASTARATAMLGVGGILVALALSYTAPANDANIGAGLLLLASVALTMTGIGGLLRRLGRPRPDGDRRL